MTKRLTLTDKTSVSLTTDMRWARFMEASNGNIVLLNASGNKQVQYSDDGGKSFLMSFGLAFHDAVSAWDDGDKLYCVGEDGSENPLAAYSENGGCSWTSMGYPAAIDKKGDIFKLSSTVYVIGADMESTIHVYEWVSGTSWNSVTTVNCSYTQYPTGDVYDGKYYFSLDDNNSPVSARVAYFNGSSITTVATLTNYKYYPNLRQNLVPITDEVQFCYFFKDDGETYAFLRTTDSWETVTEITTSATGAYFVLPPRCNVYKSEPVFMISDISSTTATVYRFMKSLVPFAEITTSFNFVENGNSVFGRYLFVEEHDGWYRYEIKEES